MEILMSLASSRAAGVNPERVMMRLSLALFFGFVSVGLPLPVVPIFVHSVLGFGDAIVGFVIGLQFLATVLTRGYAGSLADSQGGKRTMLRGGIVCAGAGLIYILAAAFSSAPIVALMVLLVGRVIAGFGESQLVTGTATWIVAAVGPQRAGKAVSWVGMSMYASVAASAPLGMVLFQRSGFMLAAGATAAAPLIACLVAFGVPASVGAIGERVPLLRVLGMIWRSGVTLALQGVGFAVIGAFSSLYFASNGWTHAGLAMTCFGLAYALMRLLFGHLPDRVGGYRIAMLSLSVESVGQALLWLAPNEATALAGAFVSGLGCSLVFPALAVEILKLIPAQSRGTALGGFVAFQDVSYGVTAPITGLLAASFGYPSVFLLGTIATALGIVVVLWERTRAVVMVGAMTARSGKQSVNSQA
jgi:MFS family permease